MMDKKFEDESGEVCFNAGYEKGTRESLNSLIMYLEERMEEGKFTFPEGIKEAIEELQYWEHWDRKRLRKEEE